MEISERSTHVFIKTEDSFTSISKKKFKGVYQIYTTKKLTSQMADQINNLFSAKMEVERINYVDGFILINLKEKASYRDIIKAIKTVVYGQN